MINRTEKLGYTFLSIIFVLSLYLGFSNPQYFDNTFAAEDNTVEYATALMLLCVSLLCFFRLFSIGKGKSFTWKLGVFLFAILFLFGAGEEISWGQRIFNIESGEYFLQNNAQKETNFHNLVVGGKKVNKIVFSQLLMVGMVIYLIFLPILYRKNTWIKKTVDRFAVPVVKWQHTIAFVISTLIVTVIPPDRKWEVYELAFGVIFFLIFLGPLNASVFDRE
ncbi:hypothetical protein OOZ15_10035 [Galbibacter sp. EGI 63066]|uniref:hypothetical protein n=1 Tax=Galbibacter sp. EGI 63066 TaxID=2993559 RepID=UPI0022497999|nr:hypothetical protein [Galbibacter sp. EGI 63066]MCX2680278.1 hypothetical protein [Galbibacter sp. EGI 63066]